MKKELSQQAIIGLIAAVVVVFGIIGWLVLKPTDDGAAKPHQTLGSTNMSRLDMIKHTAIRPGSGQ